ncbi:hypothetical protein HPP92_012810 [Vanilla planifolia]|uniref:Uncharacterized protein n=1 Tax=Vanilla planifolia TaxID=51239 RepID=A0A835V013_VANPL|nr:hypothetical protein HPP92_012810 [Vanilla planifolia]
MSSGAIRQSALVNAKIAAIKMHKHCRDTSGRRRRQQRGCRERYQHRWAQYHQVPKKSANRLCPAGQERRSFHRNLEIAQPNFNMSNTVFRRINDREFAPPARNAPNSGKPTESDEDAWRREHRAQRIDERKKIMKYGRRGIAKNNTLK